MAFMARVWQQAPRGASMRRPGARLRAGELADREGRSENRQDESGHRRQSKAIASRAVAAAASLDHAEFSPRKSMPADAAQRQSFTLGERGHLLGIARIVVRSHHAVQFHRFQAGLHGQRGSLQTRRTSPP